MGTSTSAAQFADKITKAATVTQRRQKLTVEQGALVAKEIVIAEAASNGVSPTSKIAGAKWGVRFDVKGFNNPSALLKVVGPFHLVEGDTRAHRIYRKVARKKGRGSARINKQQALNEVFGGVGAYRGGALKLPEGFRRVVNHPGTKGKGIWKSSQPKIRKAVPRVMSQRIISGWREAFR